MGYDLHITRRKSWSDHGDDITAQEWLSYVQSDPELRLRPENGPYLVEWLGLAGASWLDWSDGQIYAKSPNASLIDKMVAIARRFDAAVQGDDGEEHTSGSEPPRQSKVSLSQRVAAWLTRLRGHRPVAVTHKPLGFGVGESVHDAWGNEHIALAIDPEAEHGLGIIRTRRADGTEHVYTMIAHDLEPMGR